ncbi:MAG: hypothetical protein GY696_24100 [Gammaproteobacteria bacterium]|nr:hypothetical protein [Gammaproteobacteria bacterium]
MKTRMVHFVNEGHDVTKASEMKEALESHGGIQGCLVSVVELDWTKQAEKLATLPNITQYNNFKFDDDGVRVWKTYGIGEEIHVSNAKFGSQGSTELRIIEPFPDVIPKGIHSRMGQVSKTRTSNGPVLSCPSDNCCSTFDDHAALQQHIILDQHCPMRKESLSDTVRRMWVKEFTSVTLGDVLGNQQSVTTTLEFESPSDYELEQGWGLKTRKPTNITPKAKAWLKNRFLEGQESDIKWTPEMASKAMRSTDPDLGWVLFQPSEFLSIAQIKSLFHRFSAEIQNKGI